MDARDGPIVVAAASVAMSPRGSWKSLERQVTRIAARAARQGAELLVLPELAVLQVLAPSLPIPASQVSEHLEAFAQPYVDLVIALAIKHDLTIVAGSHIENHHNVCLIVDAKGRQQRVHKQVLTQWELVEWGLTPGPAQVSSPHVAICYDVEFPELIRPSLLAGGMLLAVPSYTETEHGFHRIRSSCLARAIESQVFVVQASLVGSLGQEPVPCTWGCSTIYAPCCPPFPANGILARTPTHRAGIAYAELSPIDLGTARSTGDVRNFEDSRNLIERLEHN